MAVTDDDAAAIVVTAAENFGVTEGSALLRIRSRLATKPGGDVVIQLSTTAGAGVTVDTDERDGEQISRS